MKKKIETAFVLMIMAVLMIFVMTPALVIGFLAECADAGFRLGWKMSDETFPAWVDKVRDRIKP